MVAGDVVNGFAASATYVTFQPAATVEVVILSVLGRDGDLEFYLYDGVTAGGQNINAVSAVYYMKRFCINNTNYLRMYSNGTIGSYTGIQIK